MMRDGGLQSQAKKVAGALGRLKLRLARPPTPRLARFILAQPIRSYVYLYICFTLLMWCSYKL